MAKASTRGFTLLEIIIALVIFAVAMVLVSAGLNMVVRTEERLHGREQRLAELQMAMLLIAHDIEQMVNRPVRDNAGNIEEALVIQPSAEKQLVFTRGGIINPDGMTKRSTLQRLAYGLKGSELVRYNWVVLDRVETSQAISRPVLKNVTRFTIDELNERGELMSIQSDPNLLPVAIVVHIDLGSEGEIHRTFALPGAMSNVKL